VDLRLLLHAGMTKTGTTALQRTLATHQEGLLESGILYPIPDPKYFHHNNLVCKVLPPESLPHVFRPGKFRNPSTVDPKDAADASWRRIVDDVARIRPPLTILSGELFYGLSRDPSSLRQFRDLLAEVFDDIEVVIYVRDPPSHYLSSQQEVVKMSHRRIRRPCDYRPTLRSRLEAFIGAFEGRVLVRTYDREQLVEREIVHDFFSSALQDAYHLVGSMSIINERESMSAEAMCITQKLRRYAFPDREDINLREVTLIRRELRKLEDEDGFRPTRPRLRPEISAMIAHRFKLDLEWLREEFGVRFLASDTEADPPAREPSGWRSRELEQLLVIERERMEAASYQLLARLARRANRHGAAQPPEVHHVG
jgi:hypothetical protein